MKFRWSIASTGASAGRSSAGWIRLRGHERQKSVGLNLVLVLDVDFLQERDELTCYATWKLLEVT